MQFFMKDLLSLSLSLSLSFMGKWYVIPGQLLLIIFHIVLLSSIFLHHRNYGFPAFFTTIASNKPNATDAVCAAPATCNGDGGPDSPEAEIAGEAIRSGEGGGPRCDLFSGRWVYDGDESPSPLYHDADCPYLSRPEHRKVRCEANGRPDRKYQRWRWRPHDCDVKRWNAREMLERIRGKRMVYVGDSVLRGQWISMVCMLQSAIPEGKKKSMSPFGNLTVFRAEEYDATVEFHWSPFLAESNQDNPFCHGIGIPCVISPDTFLDRANHYWKGADVLVFSSFLWWAGTPKLRLLWTKERAWHLEEGDGLQTMKLVFDKWADWINSYVDVEKQRVFFITFAAVHDSTEGDCGGVENPVGEEEDEVGPNEIPTTDILSGVLSRLSSKITVLNITQMSRRRKDGHQSIYRVPEEERDGSRDCVHWCLPGVPDVWNQLLFHLL